MKLAALETSEAEKAEQIARFMRGESPRNEARSVVRHLLTGCPQCLQVAGRLWRFGDEALLRFPEAGVPTGPPDGVPAIPEPQV